MRFPSGLIGRFRRLRRPTLRSGLLWGLPLAGVAALAGFGLAVWLVAFRDGGNDSQPQTIASAAPTATPTPAAGVARLIIPAINLDAPVTPTEVSEDGQMPSPLTPEQVLWYDFSALPGMGGRPGAGGNTVLAGHVEMKDYGPAVFADLYSVKKGDEITVVLSDGSEYTYAAQTNRVVSADLPFNAIVGSTPEESLTVITCAGDFDPSTQDYNERRVVWAVRVG